MPFLFAKLARDNGVKLNGRKAKHLKRTKQIKKINAIGRRERGLQTGSRIKQETILVKTNN